MVFAVLREKKERKTDCDLNLVERKKGKKKKGLTIRPPSRPVVRRRKERKASARIHLQSMARKEKGKMGEAPYALVQLDTIGEMEGKGSGHYRTGGVAGGKEGTSTILSFFPSRDVGERKGGLTKGTQDIYRWSALQETKKGRKRKKGGDIPSFLPSHKKKKKDTGKIIARHQAL